MVCSLTLINSILQASLTQAVPQVEWSFVFCVVDDSTLLKKRLFNYFQEHTGTMLGLNMAVNSTIRSLAPTIGGMMMAAYGFSSIGALGAVCNVGTLLIVRMTMRQPSAA